MAAFRDALMNGGPVNAIGVCAEIAHAIASDISRETGWMMRRVTTRTRNPLGTPEDWQLEQLRKLERDLDKNKPATELEAYRIKRESGEREYFRYLSAILIPPPDVAPCLACHGDPNSIDPAIKAILAEEYPHDRATGSTDRCELPPSRGIFFIVGAVPGAGIAACWSDNTLFRASSVHCPAQVLAGAAAVVRMDGSECSPLEPPTPVYDTNLIHIWLTLSGKLY